MKTDKEKNKNPYETAEIGYWKARNKLTEEKLDIAVDALKSAHKYYQNCVIREKQPQEINWYCTAMNIDNDIFKALDQITALEQKDK